MHNICVADQLGLANLANNKCRSFIPFIAEMYLMLPQSINLVLIIVK